MLQQRASALATPETVKSGEFSTVNPDYTDPKVSSKKSVPLPKSEKLVEPEKKNIVAVPEAAKKTAPTQDVVKAGMDEYASRAKGSAPKVFTDKEVTSKRTANSNTYMNSQGGETQRIYPEAVNYKKDGAWKPLVGNLKELATSAPLTTNTFTAGKVNQKAYRQDDGFLKLQFKPLSKTEPAVSLAADAATALRITPLGITVGGTPAMSTSADNTKYITYANAWPNTDLYYEQRGPALKEFISLKSPSAPTSFKFATDAKNVQFGKDSSGKADGTVIATLSDGSTFTVPALTVSSKVNGPIAEPKVNFSITGKTIGIEIDKTWLAAQPASSFPLIIDPTYYANYGSTINGGDKGQFIAYKSDGYTCNSYNCDMYVGSLNDRGRKR